MGHLFGLYLVGVVLSKGDLEPLGYGMNSLSDFLFLLLCLVLAAIFYMMWAFRGIKRIMGKLPWVFKLIEKIKKKLRGGAK